MPALGNTLNAAYYELQNARIHNGNPNPTGITPGTQKGLLFFNNSSNELFYWDGTIWQSAKSGAGSSGPPSGPAGGDLTGTYPNPTIGAGKVLSSHIADGTITDTDVAAANKDGANGTYSMRRLGNAAGTAMSGTNSLATIATDAAVLGPVTLWNQKITNLGTPTAGTDAATMAYVDGKTPADATTSVKGIVQLAGDLAGTAASPQIAAGVITDAEVAAANKDGAAATPSLRTLSSDGQTATAGQALAGPTRLNQMNPPNGGINMNNQKLTSLADPTSSYDAAHKQYVDNLVQGLDAKPSVRAATTANITLSGTQTIDGVPVSVGQRVLVKNQTATNENGIYVAAAGAWTRAPDADAWVELGQAYTWVDNGSVNGSTGWLCTVDPTLGTLGTTAVPWTQFSGAGQITSGAGLTKTGNTLDVGAGAGITVNADSVQVANNGITNAMLADGAVNLASADVTGALPVANGGTGATTATAARKAMGAAKFWTGLGPGGAGATWSLYGTDHGMTGPILVQITVEATSMVELPDVRVQTGGDITITWGASVTANSRRVMLVGADT